MIGPDVITFDVSITYGGNFAVRDFPGGGGRDREILLFPSSSFIDCGLSGN